MPKTVGFLAALTAKASITRSSAVHFPSSSEFFGRSRSRLTHLHRCIAATALTIGLLAGVDVAFAQLPGANSSAGQTQMPQGDSSTQAPNTQAVAASGLMPVYGIDVRVDKNWIDSRFPTQSSSFPNAGVNSSLQGTWDSLKAGGYNIVRVFVDTHDAQAANRIANLCAWAKANNVKVVVVLAGATDAGYANNAAGIVTALVNALKNAQAADAYLEIAAYQLDDEINHPGVHGQVPANITQQVMRAAQAIRSAERQSLEGSGMEPTPLIASVSFDYELIQAKAIAGVPFNDAAYQRAYASLTQFLQPLAQSPDIDLLSVSWFPGTVSSGTVENPPTLVRSLSTAFPGKQIVFVTGFSTAFHSAEEQKNYYTLSFANLGDLRASSAGESPFVGVIFREALNGKTPRDSRGLAEQMKKWDWAAKADELNAMWNGKRRSDDMRWWWENVQNNMGLATLQPISGGNAQVAPLPAQQAMSQIATAVTETSAAAGPYSTYPGPDPSTGATTSNAYPNANPAAGGQPSVSGQGGFKEGLQARMMALLEAAIQRVSSGNGQSAAAGQYPNTYPNGASTGQYPQTGQYPDPNQQYPGQNPANQYPTGGQPAGQYPQTGQYPDPNQQYPSSQNQFPTGSQSSGQYPSTNAPAGSNSAGQIGQPYGSPAGSIVISQQDITVQPSNAQVGRPVNISAKLTNRGQYDSSGLLLFATDASNTVLAQTDSVNVARGASTALALQFSPVDPQPTLALVLHVSDAMGNEITNAPLPPISVAPMAGGSNADTGDPSAYGVPSPPDASGGSGSSGPWKLRGTIGMARVAMVPLQRFLIAGDPQPVMANMSNPFAIPMRNVQVRLLIDGVAVQSQTIGMLLPHQTRSVRFPNVVVKKPGTHEVRISVQSQRGNAPPQVADLTSRVTFFSSKAPLPMTHSGTEAHGFPGSGKTIAREPPHIRSITAPPNVTAHTMAVKPVTSGASSSTGTMSQPGTSVRPTLNARNIAGGTGPQTPPHAPPTTQTTTSAHNGSPQVGGSPGSGPSGYRAMVGARPFVTVNPSEISYSPIAPAPGQPVLFSVTVRNAAEAAAPRVLLMLKLYADGRLVAMTQQPMQFSMQPRGGFRATWQAGMPLGRQVQLVAALAADGDVNPNGKQASISLRTAPTPPRVLTNPGIKIKR